MKKYLNTTIFFIIAVAVLAMLYSSLLGNLQPRMDKAEQAAKDGDMVYLNASTDSKALADLLVTHGYFTDRVDAKFAADQIVAKLQKQVAFDDLTNIAYRKPWQLSHSLIDSIGSPLYKQRLDSLRKVAVAVERGDSTLIGKEPTGGRGSITVTVATRDDNPSMLSRLLGSDVNPCADVAVLLTEHHYSGTVPVDSFICMKKTDAKGVVNFTGLNDTLSYSVKPVSKQITFGGSKGTRGGNLRDREGGHGKYTFYGKDITLPILTGGTIEQIKQDGTMAVRTFAEYKHSLTTRFMFTLLGWIALFIGLAFVGKKRKAEYALSIVTCMMMLSEISLLMMYSMGHPLTDRLRGLDTASGIIVGIVVIAALCCFNVISFFQDRYRISFDPFLSILKWLCLPYKQKCAGMAQYMRSGTNGAIKALCLVGTVLCLPLIVLDVIIIPCRKIPSRFFNTLTPNGSGYVWMAVLLTMSLFLFGTEVGGMKVNLNLGFVSFQPSEIAKYLIVMFMAAFFCANETTISRYSEAGNTKLFASKLRMLVALIVALAFLMVLYMALGDMGPALVVAITFIIVYSVVKSKINDSTTEGGSLTWRIMSCDLFYLVYGVATFAVALWIGAKIDCMGLFALLWFVAWIAFGILAQKQVHETPIMFNFVVTLFVFGGQLFSWLSQFFMHDKLLAVGNRLQSRIDMCLNTWGELCLTSSDGQNIPGENSQVAEGLWALASGGFSGQGLGDGVPRVIPANHTDMILSSIGENLGFLYIAIIFVLFCIMLKHTLNVGYRTGNRFGFYLAMGIAVVTAVQLIIITLGSTGYIPLTGVTVPFLSYGRVSMILNIAAFGIVMSLSCIHADERNAVTFPTKHYNYTVSVVSLAFLVIIGTVATIYYKYSVIQRDATLMRPLYVKNRNGMPVIEYNPRIGLVARRLQAGNIYDRTGLLLATSKVDTLRQHLAEYGDTGVNLDSLMHTKQKRYYPFGMNTYFMLGDYNDPRLFNGQRGYMAEKEHLSYLRGFDNKCLDADGNVMKVKLTSDEYQPSQFLEKTTFEDGDAHALYDYSALLPLLKAGVYSDDVEAVNRRDADAVITPKDVTLTIDARLQTTLQRRLQEHVQNIKNQNKALNWDRLRISAVVLDATTGDLLTSSVYPLPTPEAIRNASNIYRDYGPEFTRAYSDMDLGIMHPTQPGSTAKIMSSLAAIKKNGAEAVNKRYDIYYDEIIDKRWGEPNGVGPNAVAMRKAIVGSSNCYFINLVNDMDAYPQLEELYKAVGIYFAGYSTYRMMYDEPAGTIAKIDEHFNRNRTLALEQYHSYISRRDAHQISPQKMNLYPWSDTWGALWGQGQLAATPLSMARVAAIVVNGGTLPKTRFTIGETEPEKEGGPEVTYIADRNYVNQLAMHMGAQAASQKYFKSAVGRFNAESTNFADLRFGGKTGTPERILHGNKTNNDGWYICFLKDCTVPGSDGRHHNLAIAVRMERLTSGISGRAMDVVDNIVLPVLRQYQYW